MRITMMQGGETVHDRYATEKCADAAVKAMVAGDVAAMEMVSTPWEGHRKQGRPITKHHDGSLSIRPENQHIMIDVDVDVSGLIEAIQEYGKAVEGMRDVREVSK